MFHVKNAIQIINIIIKNLYDLAQMLNISALVSHISGIGVDFLTLKSPRPCVLTLFLVVPVG